MTGDGTLFPIGYSTNKGVCVIPCLTMQKPDSVADNLAAKIAIPAIRTLDNKLKMKDR